MNYTPLPITLQANMGTLRYIMVHTGLMPAHIIQDLMVDVILPKCKKINIILDVVPYFVTIPPEINVTNSNLHVMTFLLFDDKMMADCVESDMKNIDLHFQTHIYY